ncbi:MAG: DUF1887 family protein, partial [Gammaproteobacteria bacterium]|nr:DUF1887 family protein [Gammaproteobacteria bacterium]
VVSTDMAKNAELLADVLKQAVGVQVELWMIDDAWDIEHIMTRIMELLEQLSESDIALNVSGGTRPMSIAAFQVFQMYQYPVFYIHPEDDRLIWLYPRDQESHQLADRVRLNQFLYAQGSKVISQGSTSVIPEHRELAHDLLTSYKYFEKAVTTLNWYVVNTVQLKSSPLTADHQRWNPFLDLLERLESLQMIRIDNQCLVFRDNAAKEFIAGSWLEHYVFAELMQIGQHIPEIQDSAQAITIEHQLTGQAVQNELDVAFLCNNHFYVIECKTSLFDQQSGEQVGADVLYKLDSMKALFGGLNAQAMLISYKPVPQSVKHRAALFGIETCDAFQLKDLRSRLIQWLDHTKSQTRLQALNDQ